LKIPALNESANGPAIFPRDFMSAESAKSHASCLPLIVAATFFIEYLDTTFIDTALPRMARDFHAGPDRRTWP
jgi:hypothetical protein